MRAAAVRGAIALGPHAGVVVNDGVEDGREQATLHTEVASETVEDELGDGRITHEVGPAEDLEVPGDGGLGKIENGLKVGDEQGRGREAIEDAEPGRLRDGDDQARGRRQRCHMRNNEYTAR
jgi:hypothetical protein